MKPIQTNQLTIAPVEWLSIKEATRRFSLSRSGLYNLMAAGSIKSASVRQPGNIRGRRLISAESIRLFIESQAKGGQILASK